MEVRLKLAQFFGKAGKPYYFETSTRREQHHWSTISLLHLSSGTFSFIMFLEQSVSNAWWPLNRGDNNRRALVGMAKRWPLNSGFISNCFCSYFLSLFYSIHDDFTFIVTWPFLYILEKASITKKVDRKVDKCKQYKHIPWKRSM